MAQGLKAFIEQYSSDSNQQSNPSQQQTKKPEKQPVKQTPANAPGVFGQQKQTQRTRRADDVLADVASGKLKNTPRPVTYKQSNTNPQMQEGVTVNPHRGINFVARNESAPTSNFYDRVSLAARGKTDALSDSIAKEKENKKIETDPTVLNYRAAERRKKEAETELNRLKDGVKLPDGTTVLKDGTVLRPGEQEEKLAKVQEALDFRTKQSANFAKNMTKDQMGMEKHPVARTAWQMIERGAAETSHDFAGLTNAVLGQHGIIGSLLEEAGGMFGDGINNLLQMDLVNSEYIRSGDWNPVTMLYNANTNARNTVMQMSNERLANNKNAIFVADIGANTVRLLPHFFLAAYEQAIGAASAATATTAGVQQAANIATAHGALNLTSQLFRASASRMIKDPSIQVMFAQEFGRSYNVAKEDGAPNAAAIVYALTNSSISTIVEMSGGVQNLPAALQGVASLGKRELYILSNTVAEEMNEEVVQGFFERGLKAMYQQVELYSETNPNAMVNPNLAFQEAAGAALGTLFQIPVQRGIGRVVGQAVAAADYQANANSRAAFDILEKARQVDEKNDNDEATIAALNEINSNSKLREGFLKIYKTDVGVVLHEFMQSVKEEQSAEEQTTAPVQEASQEAAGEQQTAPQAETPPAPVEAPVAAPAELNSNPVRTVPMNWDNNGPETQTQAPGAAGPSPVRTVPIDWNAMGQQTETQEQAPQQQTQGPATPPLQGEGNAQTEERADTSSAFRAPSPQGEGSGETGAEQAADEGLSPEDRQAADELYNELGEQYGTIEEGENAARESNVPRQTGPREKVGEAVRTMYEAEAIPESRLPDVRSALVDEDFSFETETDEALTRDAENKIKKDGWDRAMRDWTADVRSGKANENLVAMGATLLNNAANSGMDGKSFVDLAVDYNDLCHRLGRGLEAARILKRLSPSARLYGLQKTVSRINEERNAKKSEQKKAAKDVEKALEGLDKARESALESTEKELSDPASEAAKRVAEAIRRDVDRTRAAENGEESEATREERMAKLALKLARERLNAGKGGRKVTTATDVLREIAQDEDLFREIYEKAQAEFQTEEGEDYREDVEEFTNTPPGLDRAKGTEGTKTFARAIAESAARTGENSKYIREQAALGVSSEDIARTIANNLIEETGASAQLADSIREGCRNYVNEILQGDTQSGSERAGSIVSRQMRNIGQTFRDLAAKSGATKESVRQDLADQLAMDYALDPQSAARVADSVMAEYEAQLSEAMEKELERRYGKKERNGKVSPEFRQMLEEALNLGAFDSQYAREATQKVFGTEADIKLDPKLAEAFLNAGKR